MSHLNNSVDDVVECPLCMEPLEVDDLNFFPCTCGYQICRFCWHRIRTDENELCPACRKEYPENPADFKPLTPEEMVAFKSQKRQRDQQRKQKITENRKHLANVRVVQKNLVFVVGLPPRLADADILKKHEYFGKYGKIHKVVINPSTTYAGVQGPSASAYVTYVHNTDALRAIQSVNNIMIDGRLIKTSLGTTKYCSHFMKNQQCPKADCMYLHELGDPEASFTKEEMHQGKHQEYEKRLHDLLIATSGASSAGGIVTTSSSSSLSNISSSKTAENNKMTGIIANPSCTTSNTPLSSNCSTSNSTTSSVAPNGQQKEAWPSLSISPVNQKESSTSNVGVVTNKNKKERIKQEKNKATKTKNKNTNNNNTCKELVNDSTASSVALTLAVDCNSAIVESTTKTKVEKTKDRNQSNQSSNRLNQRKEVVSATTIKENEIKEFDKITIPSTVASLNLENINEISSNKIRNTSDSATKTDSQRSLSSSANSGCIMTTSNNTSSPLNESVSGKSSPNSFHENSLLDEHNTQHSLSVKVKNTLSEMDDITVDHNIGKTNLSNPFGFVDNFTNLDEENAKQSYSDNLVNSDDVVARHQSRNIEKVIFSETPLSDNKKEDVLADTISKLNLFDENSFFSSSSAVLQQSMLLKNKHSEELISNQLNSGTMPNLPDLISGIDGYQNNTNDWEEAFKNVMLKSNKQMEEKMLPQSLHQHQLQQQLQQHHHHQQHHPHNQIKHQEDLHRLQELQKRNSLLSSLSLSQLNGAQNEFQTLSNNYLTGGSNVLHQQQQQHQLLQQHQSNQNLNDNILQNTLFGTNMSKFFDFHKNQQHKLQQHCIQNNASSNIIGGVNDNMHMLSLLDNNRMNTQLMEQHSLLPSQQHQKQQEMFGKMDPMLSHHQLQQAQNPPHGSAAQSQQQNQFMQNSNADDDLGFDPFIETQKALAELIENEEEMQNFGTATPSKLIPHKPLANNLQQQQQQQPHQQQMMDYMQRARMPPPGFNHVNNFGGYGAVPRLPNNSKIMPFMNLSSNYAGSSGQPIQQQQPQQPPQMQIPNNAWNTHLGNFQSQINDQQVRQVNSNPLQSGVNQKSYSGNDWTAMDPAILSFRQFSFPQQTQVAPHLQPQQQQQDIFLQQLAQQQQQPGGFNSQSQHLGGNVGIPNTLLNSQQNSQAHVNANVQGMLEYLKTRQFV